ncbi:hypothetical protein IFR05_011147 [Cadophora sp. M221]|nr:hypothetical protein IFR05_011147 [Cadophora sp. M221]
MVLNQEGSTPDYGVWKESNGVTNHSDGSDPPSYPLARPQSLDLTHETEDRIQSLARVFSGMSKAASSNTTMVNPFDDHKIPALDPFSTEFDAEEWAKHFFHTVGSDPERYPQRTAGIAYRDVAVFGFGSDTDYQKDVVNVMFHAANLLKESFRPKQRVPILTDFDGLIKSGEMCIVLGRPGSGVSTLLKTIAGKTHGLSVSDQASFNYQGISRDMMQSQYRGELIYQAETDVHFPRLTVGQTLMLAAQARTPRNRTPGVSRHRYAEHLRDVVLAVFGLSHTINTQIGNDYIRGVSGGERKRVSIAEVMLTQASLQCWDNSTRGLDSAAALQFVETLRLASNMTGATTAVAVYQASQEIYDIFDTVALLYEGRQIFFGKTNEAQKFFTDMGYVCPPRQTTADFLTSLTSPDERVIAPGFEHLVPRTPDEFAKRWGSSQHRMRLLQEIASFEEAYPIAGPHLDQFNKSWKAQKGSLTRSKSPYTLSVPMQVQICITRGFQRLRGEMAFTLITIFANLLISLVLGSIFYDLPDSVDGFYGRGALLFVAVLFNALTSALEVLPLYVTRPVIEKHVSFAFYHPVSDAIASMITELPTKIICTITFNVPLYFMANLRRDAGSFFIYLILVFSCTLTMSMIFRLTGQVTRTISQAVAPMTVLILLLTIYTGFILPIRSMQGWLRWLNYLNPIAYAFEALMANEFHGREFPCYQFLPAGPMYANATGTQRACSVAGGAPGSSFIDGDMYINAIYEYFHSHLWRNFGIMIAFILFFMAAYLLAAEKVTFEESKGDVLIYRRGDTSFTKSKSSADEEAQGGNERSINTASTLVDGNKSDSQPIIQQQTAILHWKNVCYDISIKGKNRVILDHVNGWVKPGTLTALMGASGAGKTSLLNTLANRNEVGVVRGDILVNGRDRPNSFQRQTGYVQQQDIHLLTSTVREALQFSALLRQPATVSRQEKLDYVEEIIKLLEMEKYAGAVVGVPGEGLNVEQRKRLTIGVELVAKPDLLLFLDEPTSGLDSQTAWSILTLIRKLADNGQAILCTIHQPSAVLFQRFDRLLLLARGGQTVYFGDIGDNSKTLVDYFESGGADPCDPERNPAEWMLEVIGAAPGATANRDWIQAWKDSPEFVAVNKHLDEMKEQLPSKSSTKNDASLSKSYAAPFHVQLAMCTRRAFEQSWRDPSYIYSKIGLCSTASLFLGLSFLNQPVSLQGVQNQIFSFFMLLVIQVFMCYQAMPNFITQRDLYEARERPAKTYTWKAFMIGNIMVEIPWNTLAALILFICMYYPIGLQHNAAETNKEVERGGLMFFLMWTFMMFGVTFTSMVVAGAQSAEVGAIIAVILFAMSLIFSGVLVHFEDLPGFWKFMYRVSPFTYLISAFISTGLGNTTVHCSPLELITLDTPSGQTCGQYLAAFMEVAGGTLANPEATQQCQYCTIANTTPLLANLDSFYEERWRNLGLLWIYVCFNAGAALFFYWLARVPKQWSKVLKIFSPKVVEELH